MFSTVAGTIVNIPNEIINANIQEAANRSQYDEIDLILEGIDAASAKELAQNMIKKVLHPEGIY